VYCRKSCQVEHWGLHRYYCKTPEQQAAQVRLDKMGQLMIGASAKGVLRAVGLYLAQGADVNYHWPESGGFTALRMASLKGQLAVVDALLAAPRVKVDAVCNRDYTACHVACVNAKLEVLRSLIRAEANVNKTATSTDSHGFRPLHLAA